MTCPKCDAINLRGATTCFKCGAPLTPRVAPAGATAVPGYPPVYGGWPQPRPATASVAIASMVLGIVSWVLCAAGILTAIPAVILGHRARRIVDQSRGRLKGSEMAMAGLVLGYASLTIWGVYLGGALLAYLSASRQFPEHEAVAVSNIRRIVNAQTIYDQTYLHSYKGRHFARELAMLGPGPGGVCKGSGDEKFACLLSGPLAESNCTGYRWCNATGYKFQLQINYGQQDQDYAITAAPMDSLQGNLTFCATSDGVIRSEKDRLWNIIGYKHDECLKLKPYSEAK